MATTYDPTLPTQKDWVRFLIGDTNGGSIPFVFTDEEILAALTEAPGKYCAAALLLLGLRMRFLTGSGGVSSKTVDGLSITKGVNQSPTSALTDAIDRLQALCTQANAQADGENTFLKVYQAHWLKC